MPRNRRKPTSHLTVSRVSKYSTKQLSKRTWSDFERLFEAHPAPGAYLCWCMHNHRPGPDPGKSGDSRVILTERNRRAKKVLVEQKRSHGILVYTQGEPVGWCQYGLREELPRIDNNSHYHKLACGSGEARWRITCFVVHNKYRRRGLARTALKAALTAIKKAGGGLVEVCPIKRWGAYEKYRGTVSMFKKEGLRTVGPLGQSNVVMRRTI
jgi:ribosomal protein S18 acetylase RimI-like enzyme